MTDRPSCQVPAIRGTRIIQMEHAFERGLGEYLRTYHHAGGLTDLYGRFGHGEAEFHALLNKDMLRLMFVLEGCRSRPDLEAKMDWGNKGRVLVLEKA